MTRVWLDRRSCGSAKVRGRAFKLHIGGTGCEKQEPEKLRMPV